MPTLTLMAVGKKAVLGWRGARRPARQVPTVAQQPLDLSALSFRDRMQSVGLDVQDIFHLRSLHFFKFEGAPLLWSLEANFERFTEAIDLLRAEGVLQLDEGLGPFIESPPFGKRANVDFLSMQELEADILRRVWVRVMDPLVGVGLWQQLETQGLAAIDLYNIVSIDVSSPYDRTEMQLRLRSPGSRDLAVAGVHHFKVKVLLKAEALEILWDAFSEDDAVVVREAQSRSDGRPGFGVISTRNQVPRNVMARLPKEIDLSFSGGGTLYDVPGVGPRLAALFEEQLFGGG